MFSSKSTPKNMMSLIIVSKFPSHTVNVFINSKPLVSFFSFSFQQPRKTSATQLRTLYLSITEEIQNIMRANLFWRIFFIFFTPHKWLGYDRIAVLSAFRGFWVMPSQTGACTLGWVIAAEKFFYLIQHNCSLQGVKGAKAMKCTFTLQTTNYPHNSSHF